MSLRKAVLKLAQEHPDFRHALVARLRTKAAGGISYKIFPADEKAITPRMILQAVQKAGWTGIDPKTLEMDAKPEIPDYPPGGFTGGLVNFRVFPKGAKTRAEALANFGGYPWGYVFSGVRVAGQTVTVTSFIYVNI